MVNPAERLKVGTQNERVKAEIEFCTVLVTAFDLSGKPRKQIADELGKRLDRDLSASMLNDFTRIGERERAPRFPAAWIPDLCVVLGNTLPQQHVLTPVQRSALELGERHSEFDWVFENLRAGLTRLIERASRKKGKGKRSRKTRRRKIETK